MIAKTILTKTLSATPAATAVTKNLPVPTEGQLASLAQLCMAAKHGDHSAFERVVKNFAYFTGIESGMENAAKAWLMDTKFITPAYVRGALEWGIRKKYMSATMKVAPSATMASKPAPTMAAPIPAPAKAKVSINMSAVIPSNVSDDTTPPWDEEPEEILSRIVNPTPAGKKTLKRDYTEANWAYVIRERGMEAARRAYAGAHPGTTKEDQMFFLNNIVIMFDL